MKKRVVWKFLWAWQFQEEEEWLNKMSREGWALTSYFFFRYQFERCEPGQWLYRIEMLEDPAGSPKSRDYLEFLEGTGVECVASWQKWVYLRRPASEGSFDLFSDLDSRIRHLSRILNLLYPLFLLNLVIGIVNGINLALGAAIYLWVPLMSLVLAFVLWNGAVKVRRRREALERERSIRE